jgi:hypothetical protein
VAAGYTAALTLDVKVRCWGQNTFFECEVPPDLDFAVAISCGSMHVTTLTRAGKVVCWGNRIKGQFSPLQALRVNFHLFKT